MSVKHVTGNLLDFTDWNVLAHVTNDKNTFGSGLAAQIKEEFPAAYDADTAAHAEVQSTPGSSLLGTFSAAEVLGGKRIVNVYAMEGFGRDRRYLDYEAFYVGLSRLKQTLENAHAAGRIYSLGVPYKMGSDRAGGSWRVCEAMILDIFETSPIEVFIVQLPRKSVAEST